VSEPETKVACGERGTTTAATYLCRHLSNGVAVGFHSFPREGDPWPDAWCDACHARFLAAGGEWTEASEAGLEMQLVCAYCYERFRDRNQRVPPELDGRLSSLSADEARLFVHAAVHRLQEKQTAAARAGFDLAAAKRWHYESDDQRLTLTRADGSRFQAAARLAGSFSTTTSTWLWGWANESQSETEVRELHRLQTFGKIRGLDQLVSAQWTATEYDGWEMTAVAADVLGARAAYRAPTDHLYLFLLLMDLVPAT